MGIEFIISNNTIVLGQRKEQSNTHLELERGAQKKRDEGAISKGAGAKNEKTPSRTISEAKGVPQFNAQKCMKWAVARIKARWWSLTAHSCLCGQVEANKAEVLTFPFPGAEDLCLAPSSLL